MSAAVGQLIPFVESPYDDASVDKADVELYVRND